ncbi:hypothetical protein GGQ85_001178 [Nitrobacter vulgaris]|nr:hypothetical protein [Nitrobacter vulgaris]
MTAHGPLAEKSRLAFLCLETLKVSGSARVYSHLAFQKKPVATALYVRIVRLILSSKRSFRLAVSLLETMERRFH